MGDRSKEAEAEALDAYSRVVTTVADRLAPAVANLRVRKSVGRGRAMDGAGSGVVMTPDGFALTAAHVVDGVERGTASFTDGGTRRIIAALMRDGRFRRAYLGIAGGSRPLPPRLIAEIGRERGIEVVE